MNDFNGIVTARFEWLPFHYVAQNDKGLITKETLRTLYDGTLWTHLEAQATKKRGREVWPRKRQAAAASAEAPPPSEEKAASPKAKRASAAATQVDEKTAAAAAAQAKSSAEKQKGA